MLKIDASKSVSAIFTTLFSIVADPVMSSPNDPTVLTPAVISPVPQSISPLPH
jgi:hypothetical protein